MSSKLAELTNRNNLAVQAIGGDGRWQLLHDIFIQDTQIFHATILALSIASRSSNRCESKARGLHVSNASETCYITQLLQYTCICCVNMLNSLYSQQAILTICPDNQDLCNQGKHRFAALFPRFAPENRSELHQTIHIPFGAGPRSCIAMRLALLEMKVAIVKLLKTFRFERTSETLDPV